MKGNLEHFIASFHNAQNAGLESFSIVKSIFLTSILDLLTINGYITGYSHKGDYTYVYFKHSISKKYRFELVSRSSKRVHMTLTRLAKKYQKNEFLLLSSSYGLITSKEAYILRCGGEVILRVIE